MASLSSSREAEHHHLLKLGLAVAVGLVQGGAALFAHPAAAQQQVPASPTGEDERADTAPGREPSLDIPPPEPSPVLGTLDDLIPPEALADPEAWAAQGIDNPSTVPLIPLTDDMAGGELRIPAPDDGPALLPSLDEAFADFELDLPEPLSTDPEVEALAEIDAPDLIDMPELAVVRISDSVTLGFPAAPGAFPEQREFVERFSELSTIEQLDEGRDSAPQVGARARADEELLGEILRTYGYYSGEVVRQLSGGRRTLDNGETDAGGEATDPRVRFDILPGPRYSFGAIDLGALEQVPAADLARFLAVFGIEPGDPLYADRILQQEIELRVALGENGYPFAEVGEPRLRIDHAANLGALSLPVRPGGKYAFGEVVSSDPDFLSSRHLSRIARFEPGDIYQRSLETDLRRAILATGLVSSVAITARETIPPASGDPGRIALDVELEPAPLRTVAGAIGYGTEDGIKLEARWEHRNLFPPEGALRLRGILGTREQLASIGFRRNNFLDRDQVLLVDVFASDITTQAVDARTIGVRGSFEKISNILFQKEFSWLAGGEVLYTDERNRTVRIAPGTPVPRRTFLIAGLFGSATVDESDDLLDPSRGYRATLFLAPEASRSQGSEEFYLRAQADASIYQPLGSTVIAGRVRAATIQGAAVDEIAPSRRLYAGGGGSVRGYGFQGVGPRTEDGLATGGTSLLEFSLEARIETPLFDGAVEVVPFVDAGTVGRGSTPDFDNIRFGAGIGLRYKTSFGPIRVDVATPINPSEFDSPVVVYVSLGQAF